MTMLFNAATPDGFNFGNVATFSGASALTISAWVRKTSLSDYEHVIDKGPSVTSSFGLQESGAGEGTNNDVSQHLANGGGAGGYTTGNIITTDGLFHHWCMVYDGTLVGNAARLKFFFDGVQQTLSFFATVPATTATNTNSMFMGMAEWENVGLTGTLDDVRTYNRALAANEVEAIYNCRGHDGIAFGLVNRWKLRDGAPGEAQAFPVRASVTATALLSGTTTNNVSMPATVNVGDNLYVSIGGGNFGVFSTPTDWIQLWQTTNGTCRHALFLKYADGTEGGTTVNFSSASLGQGAAQAIRVTGARNSASTIIGTQATGFSANPNPPAVGPSTGPENLLYMCFFAGDDDDATTSGYPAGWSGGTSIVSGGGTNNGGEVGTAYLQSTATSEDAGTFTLSQSENWIAGAIAIRPTPGIYDITGNNDGQGVGTPTFSEGVLPLKRRFT